MWAAAAVPLLAFDLGHRMMLNNDEARFPVLAGSMLDGGRWLVPNLLDRVYLNKPVLLAWLIALTSWPAGHVTPLTAVLPSALAAGLTVAAVYAIARRLFGVRAGGYAALTALTTQGLVLHGRLAMPDMLVTACTTVAVWMLVRMRDGARGAWIGFYVATAVAFWSKGSSGFLPLAIALGVTAVGHGPRRWHALHLAPGLALLAVLVAPWWLLALGADADVARHAFVREHLFLYLAAPLHARRWIDPFANLLGIVFPWIAIGAVAAVRAVQGIRGRGDDREPLMVAITWAAVAFVAAAVSAQQRLRYYLFVLPAIAVLIGWWVDRAAEVSSGLGARARRTLIIVLAVGAPAALAATAAIPCWRVPGWPLTLVLGIALAVIATAPLLVTGSGRMSGRVFAVCAVAVSVLLLASYHVETRTLGAEADYPRLRAELGPALGARVPLAVVELDVLPFVFYFRDARVIEVRRFDDLPAVRASVPDALVLIRASEAARLVPPARVVLQASLRGRAVTVVRTTATP